jgi:hypothetical protein
VDFVHDHVPEFREEAAPPAVIGEERPVEHVRIREDEPAGVADLASGRLGGVAVVHAGLDRIDQIARGIRGAGHRFEKPGQPLQLVLGQRLGGEEVQSGGVRIGHQTFEDREVVSQRLAAGRAGDDHHVVPQPGQVNRLRLVAVQALDPPGGQGLREDFRERSRRLGMAGRSLGEAPHVRHLAGVVAFPRDPGEEGIEVVALEGQGGGEVGTHCSTYV